MYFIVAVYKQNKLLLEDAITMEEDNSFEDLLIETLGYITEEKVTLKFFNTLTNHWAGIRDLNTKLIFCKNFEPCQLQFTLNTTESESLEDTRTNINPLERMMKNSKRLPSIYIFRGPQKSSISSKTMPKIMLIAEHTLQCLLAVKARFLEEYSVSVFEPKI